MSVRYAIKTVVFESGERFAFLVDRRTGIPMFDVTAFTLSEFRQINRASATIEQVLRALKVWHLFCDLQAIVLDERMREGRLMDMGEIEALMRVCRRPLSDIETSLGKTVSLLDTGIARVRPLEAYRYRSKVASAEVAGNSAGLRVRYIRKYLEWKANGCLLRMAVNHPIRAALASAKDTVVSTLNARAPSGKGRNTADDRIALAENVQSRLWDLIEPGSQENPWVGCHTQVRNELIVRWFMGLGVRRGELLGVKISDIDLRANEVFIARRPDDKDDPRADQPNAKTNDRYLILSADLAERTRNYILDVRRNIAGARKHPFLFVANGGAPLSKAGLNKIFRVLSNRHPELGRLFPHLLRHTWNDNFSKTMDAKGETPEHEKKMRSRLMGWNPTSNTAEIYNKRHVERKAKKASLELQENMVKPNEEHRD